MIVSKLHTFLTAMKLSFSEGSLYFYGDQRNYHLYTLKQGAYIYFFMMINGQLVTVYMVSEHSVPTNFS